MAGKIPRLSGTYEPAASKHWTYVVQVDLADRDRLLAVDVAGEFFEAVADPEMDLVDGRQVAEDLFDLGLVEDGPGNLVLGLNRLFEQLEA